MADKKYLIINADDFGQSAGVNRGIIQAFEMGVVTSTSMMVRWPAAVEAAQYGRKTPELSVGLHVDFGEWAYCDGSWMLLYEVVAMQDPRIVSEEIFRQLAKFQNLMAREPTHIDSHQHVHRDEPIRSVLAEVASHLSVPLRDVSSSVRYCGDFYGQGDDGQAFPDNISSTGLIKILADLLPGYTELGCHPAAEADLNTMYSKERLVELKVLCDHQIRDAVQKMDIELCSFHDVRVG